MRRRHAAVTAGVLLCALLWACDEEAKPRPQPQPLDPELVAQGEAIFRHDTFGNEPYWSGTLRLHEVIATSVSPSLALQVGLKVDAEALPQQVVDAIAAGAVDLDDPATTVTLLSLGAVVGVEGRVEEDASGALHLLEVGITCALCHSTVDDSFAPGIGRRLDGWPNRDLDVGAIVALSPALDEAQKSTLRAWGPGFYDPRGNIDGLDTPVVLPPAYGLREVARETYTGEGLVSYWNAYVAVTQMHGQGDFEDARLGIAIDVEDDRVTPKLPALREYQLSLSAPPPPAGSFDEAAAGRGRVLFEGDGRCATCHLPDESFTDINRDILHEPAETGMDAAYAMRTTQKAYRTTPLRGVWQRPPYFHDGSAATLAEVVAHYDAVLGLGLDAQAQADLTEYLKSL